MQDEPSGRRKEGGRGDARQVQTRHSTALGYGLQDVESHLKPCRLCLRLLTERKGKTCSNRAFSTRREARVSVAPN